MENSDNEAGKNLKSFLCRVRASNECTAWYNLEKDFVFYLFICFTVNNVIYLC